MRKACSTMFTMVGSSGRGIDQTHGRLHGERMAAFLDDTGAFAVILADDNQRPALNAGRRQVRQTVRGDIGADNRLPGYRTTQGVIDGGRQHGRRRGFVGAYFEMNAQFIEDGLGIGQNVHKM